MTGKKPYYPNNWKDYKDAPDEMFHQHTFEEIMEWKVANWELPSSVACVIRVRNTDTYKVKEYVYERASAARAKVIKLCKEPNIEITICDHESIHHLSQPE